MFYLIYKITNTIDGKVYIGSHKTSNINDEYMGSGKYLKRAIEKYGLEYFSKEILHIYDNPSDMYKKEAELVNEDFLASANTYNLKVGGEGGWDYINSNKLYGFSNRETAVKGALTTNLIRTKRHSERMKTDVEYREKCSMAVSEGLKRYYENGGKNAMQDKTHSAEARTKISEAQTGLNNSQFGTMWITNGIENKKIKKTDIIPNGWNKGRKIFLK